MGLRIRTNVESLRAQKELSQVRERFNHVQNKLSTGSRIIRALDDAAGLAISENIRATQRATDQNINNAENALLMLETAEGGLNQVTNIVIRMKELAIQSASDHIGDKERTFINAEFFELQTELERIAQTTEFNGRSLLNGEGENVVIQVGTRNNEELDRIDVTMNYSATLENLELDGLNVQTSEEARQTIEPINVALERIASVRGVIGASESRLHSTIAHLMEYNVNMSSAYSRIRDADLARETAELAKYNILSQAGVAVLAQANNAPQLALKLLG